MSIDEVMLFKDIDMRLTPVCLGAHISKVLARQTDKDQLAENILSCLGDGAAYGVTDVLEN
ncbi:hypothetical protein L1D29_18120 [Shewanella insulae]|uniref:hypothetical protein n=1 Tax=Shewanella insulae TaxID=2681496 RepID=UPI001EFE390B|nr:hypothetical protein [Shewanella insulae]MCG9714721.1 hypothetical protein [Shewanella insulae]